MLTNPVIAIVGAGFMGSSHARVVGGSAAADLGIVIDAEEDAAERLARAHWARASTHLEDALSADAVIVAASTASHVDCALPFLEAGLPTFVEKPLGPDLAGVELLLAAAEKGDVPLMCGFVERFNAAFRTAAEQMTTPPTQVLTVRHSPPAPRIASSVVADMLLHDLDVVVRLFGGEEPRVAAAACHRPTSSDFNEIADCSLAFQSGLANLSTNRMSQRKVRSLTIHTSTESIDVDLLRQDVTVHRHVSQEMVAADGRMGYRASTEVEIPFVRHTGEPLALQFAHFLRLIEGREDHDAERRSIHLPHLLMDAVETAHRPTSSSIAARQAAVASEP